jgi:RNA polymerase sigma-70 factor (ECF subfamily)
MDVQEAVKATCPVTESRERKEENDDCEQQYVRAAQEGDEIAFEWLVKKYDDVVYRYAMRLAGKPQMARDVLQNVWLTVFKQLRRLTNPGSFKSWIFKIAYCRCQDLFREQGREHKVVKEYLSERRKASSVPEPIDILVEEEIFELLRKHLQKLTTKKREVLELKIEGKSEKEIAGIVGCKVGTVKSRIHKGLAKIKRLCMEEGES